MVWDEPALGKQVTVGIYTASPPAYMTEIAAHQLLQERSSIPSLVLCSQLTGVSGWCVLGLPVSLSAHSVPTSAQSSRKAATCLNVKPQE